MRILRISDLKSWISENNVEVLVVLAAIAWFFYDWYRQGGGLFGLVIPLGSIVLYLVFARFRVRNMIARDARALVCSLGDHSRWAEEAEADAYTYRGHFPAVEVSRAAKLVDLLATLSAGDFRILHLLVEFADDGKLVEAQGTRAEVAPLFELCRTKKLLFVYFGGNLPNENRGAVFERVRAARLGHDFPLVITTARGSEFSLFLDRLLRDFSKGMTLHSAWLKLRPQDARPGAPQPAADSGPQALLFL